jgi:hypothetical protein
MRHVMIGALALLVTVPALWGQDKKDPPTDAKPAIEGTKAQPATPGNELAALKKEEQKAETDLIAAYRKAKTGAEREKVLDQYKGLVNKYSGRFLDFAKKNEKDPVAFDALVWIMQNQRGSPSSPAVNEAMGILADKHVGSEKMGQVAQALGEFETPMAEPLLKAILEKNPNRAIQGQACLSLGYYFKNRSEAETTTKSDVDKLQKEAEKYLDLAGAKYADVKYGRDTVGPAAKNTLFELQHLALGKTSPEIEGKDSGGKEFKLSDYRGKVVVLDFWASW